MDLSRLLNPLGPDSEQAPPPSSEPATHNDSSFYTSSSTFHGQQYENNNSQDRQEFDNTGNRRHGSTSSVEQLGGLATLHIEGGHHYRNQQLSSRHEHPVYDPSPQHIQVRPGLYSRSSWDNNNYFSGMEDTLMDHQDQQQQEHELEQLTSPRTKRKYLKKLPSSFAGPSRRGSNQQDSDEQDSSSTSNSNTTNNSSTNSTGGTGSGGGGGGGGNISSSGASTAKRRRPALVGLDI
ncbi:hypothetical protein BGX29_003208 [Mortierella sp. GBA35]|nr:hypothetical protein BGX29_003208 [Mortierella sp. GBA35]